MKIKYNLDLIKNNSIPIEYIYIVLGLIIGLFYMFFITPFSVPDEPHHYHSSYILSNYFLFQKNKTQGLQNNFDYSKLTGHFNVSSAYVRLKEEGVYRVNIKNYIEIPEPYNLNYFIYYIPQAIGISIARILKLNFFGVIYIGRFFNLLFYIICVFLSLKLLKEFKLTILLIGLLPMSMHQAASFSYDSFINGISLLFISYLLYILYEKKNMENKDIIIMAILSALLAPTKIVYFPIILLIFLIIPYIYGWKDKKGYIISLIIIMAGIFTVLIFSLNSIKNVINPSNITAWHGSNNYQISYILNYPLNTIKIFWDTIISHYDIYFFGSFGNYLSGLTLHLPREYIYFYILLVIISLFSKTKYSWVPEYSQRIIYLLVIITIVLLTMLSMFLAWTPDNSNIIHGVQGRYFTPLIPLLFLTIRNKYFRNLKKYSYILILLFIVLQIFTLRYIYNYTIMN